MDITPFLELKIAPRAVFDSLAERGSRVRFMVADVPSRAERAACRGERPDRGDWRAVTWAAFAADIRRIACFLTASELAPGARAAVYAPNRVEWIAAALGIQAAGGVMVPIYPASTAEQAAYVLAHADAEVVFVDTAPLLARLIETWSQLASVRRIVLLAELDVAAAVEAVRAKGRPVPALAEVERRVVTLTEALAIGAARDAAEPGGFEARMAAVSLDQPGLMLYTSGTSGNPKGVPLTHRNVAINGLDWLRSNAPLLAPDAVDLLWLPMSHIFGFGEACLGNTLGFVSYLCDPASVLGLLPVVRPSVFMSVPSLWEKLAHLAGGSPERLRELCGGNLGFCLSGGAGLKREVKEAFHAAGLLIIEGYGLTETSPTLTLNRPDAFRFDSVGRPLPSVELRLAEDGEILARGPSVFAGYHKDPAATREAFTDDGWFKTGDVGRFTEDGFLQIIDRKKDILVTAGGKNVAPANIEVRFQGDALIAHLLVYGDGRRYLTAGVWLNPDAAELAGVAPEARAAAAHALVAARIERTNAELASYETIKKFCIMPAPLTVAGGQLTATLKVKRKRVYQEFAAAFEGLYA